MTATIAAAEREKRHIERIAREAEENKKQQFERERIGRKWLPDDALAVEAARALCQLTDGDSWYDLEGTGLPEADCRRIVALAAEVRERKL